MRRIGFFIAGMIIIGIFFNACYAPMESEAKDKYYYELFRVSKVNYNSVPMPSSVTFNSIMSYRNALKYRMTEFLQSGSDVTQDFIYTFLIQRGVSPVEANNEISGINYIGNDVLVFEDAISTNNYIIMYIEKQR